MTTLERSVDAAIAAENRRILDDPAAIAAARTEGELYRVRLELSGVLPRSSEPAVLVQQVRAPHDRDGNPRRAWLVYGAETPLVGSLLAIVDEGYAGRRVLLDVLSMRQYANAVELPTLDVPPAEYRRLLGVGKAIGGRVAVETESELELRAAYGDK